MAELERCACQPGGHGQFYTGTLPERAIGKEVDPGFELLEAEEGCCKLRCGHCGRLWQADALAGGGIYGDWDWHATDGR